MQYLWFRNWRTWVFAGVLLAIAAAGYVAFWAGAIQRQARRVQDEVAEIRGRPFKEPVIVEWTSREQWREFMRKEFEKAPKIRNYWDVARMLGLYRGADREPPEEIFAGLLTNAAAAYDANRHAFMLLMGMNEQDRNVVFAHELYHGFQDQYFDLQRYLLDKSREVDANGDEVLARQSVVEGEAAYVDAIYQARDATNSRPSREQIANVIAHQGEWNPELWEKIIAEQPMTEEQRVRLQQSIDMRDRLPPFMFELFMSPYIDGMAFIHAIHERGWTEVEKLYREYPPVSTEQILHPEKWFAREEPVRIAWPEFHGESRFWNWQLLHVNMMGERGWQVVFREQGLRDDALAAAAGWNGDRFAVFKHRHDEVFLMLMFTSWDTPGDAAEFADAYRRLLESKYRGTSIPTRLVTQDREVLIVEGGLAEAADAFMEFNRRAVLTGK